MHLTVVVKVRPEELPDLIECGLNEVRFNLGVISTKLHLVNEL